MTLKQRILLVVVGAVAAGLVLAGTAVGVADYVIVGQQVTLNLEKDVTLVRQDALAGQRPFLPVSEGWAIYVTADGVNWTREDSGGAPLPQLLTTPGEVVTREGYYLTTLASADVAIVVGESQDAAYRPMRRLLTALGLTDIGVLILVGLGASFLSDRALSRLRRAAETAERLGESGRPEGSLPEADSPDEVGTFVRAVNGLLSRLDAAFRELEVARERERSFVADASHDLKTPLTIVKGNVDLLTRPDLDETSRREAVREANFAVTRMTALLDRLVLAARGEIETKGEKERLDLAEEVESLVGRFAVRMDGRSLEKDIREAPPVVLDRMELERALDVLMDNALRYTDSEKGRIRVGSGREGHRSFIYVEDNGPGVAPRDRERVFERFVRLDPARSPGGHGLGLSIARAITRAAGGEIRLEEASGGGARFTLLLPAEDTLTSGHARD